MGIVQSHCSVMPIGILTVPKRSITLSRDHSPPRGHPSNREGPGARGHPPPRGRLSQDTREYAAGSRHDTKRKNDTAKRDEKMRTLHTTPNKPITNHKKGTDMKSTFLGVLAFVLAAMLMVSPSAFAGGTKAGSTIRNIATLTYYAGGGGTQLSAADTVDVTVETIVGVNVALTNAVTTTIGDGTRQEVGVTVTNTGNGTDTYNLAYTVPSGWSTAYQDSIYFDTNGNGVLDASEWIAGNVVSASTGINGWTYDENGNSATQGTYKFIVVTYAPQYLAANTTHVDSVQVDGTLSPTTGNVAEGSLSTTWTIQRAAFSVNTKTIDTTSANGYGNTAGSTVEYTITLTAASGTNLIAATNIAVRDTLPGNLTYVATSAAASVGTPTFGSGVVSWDVASLAPGATATLTFEATINAGVSGGTGITNTANIAYDDANTTGEWTRDVTPAPFVTLTVVGFGWAVDIADSVSTSFGAAISSETAEPNNRIFYRLRLTNTGSVSDEAVVSFSSAVTNAGSSPASWSWSFYLDGGTLGTFEPGTGDGLPLAMNYTTATTSSSGVVYIWAVYTPQYNTPYNAFDVTQYIAASNSDNAYADTATSTTNVNAPFITVTKTVYGDASGAMGSAITSAAPGDTLWYQVYFINGGDATASTVGLTDAIPVNTIYLAGTVQTSPDGSTWTTRTDGSDADPVAASQGGGVNYTFGSLSAGQDEYMRFRVTVR